MPFSRFVEGGHVTRYCQISRLQIMNLDPPQDEIIKIGRVVDNPIKPDALQLTMYTPEELIYVR